MMGAGQRPYEAAGALAGKSINLKRRRSERIFSIARKSQHLTSRVAADIESDTNGGISRAGNPRAETEHIASYLA